MRTELPAERLHRRLGADPGTDAPVDPDSPDPKPNMDQNGAPDEDQNSLLPRWLPDASEGRGWVARVRADPGRAGAIALAVVAALAVLVTVFTMLRDRHAPVMSAKLPPVERAASASPRSSATPGTGQPASPDRPVAVSVVRVIEMKPHEREPPCSRAPIGDMSSMRPAASSSPTTPWSRCASCSTGWWPAS